MTSEVIGSTTIVGPVDVLAADEHTGRIEVSRTVDDRILLDIFVLRPKWDRSEADGEDPFIRYDAIYLSEDVAKRLAVALGYAVLFKAGADGS